MVNVGEIAVGC